MIEYGHRRYKGMLYIGNRPTVRGVKRNIEVNIFDFDRDIYGDSLTVSFYNFLRGDMKFNDLEELKSQLHLDKADALQSLVAIR